MDQFIAWVSNLSWGLVAVLVLTLGLAPYKPPHVWEKLQMLVKGQLVKPLDWFDLCLHGFAWVVLVIKIFLTMKGK